MAQDTFPGSHTLSSTGPEDWSAVERTLSLLTADCPIKPPAIRLIHAGCEVGQEIARRLPGGQYCQATERQDLRNGLGALEAMLKDESFSASNILIFVLPQSETMIAAEHLIRRHVGIYWDRRNGLPFGGVLLIDTALGTVGRKGVR